MSYVRTLVLNSFYRPHQICDWKEAVTRMFKGTVEVLAQYDEVLGVLDSATLKTFPDLKKALRMIVPTDVDSITLKVPAVVVLRRKTAQVKSGVKFSKTNVSLRDDFRCQYCATRLPMSQLNYDHVVPRHQGGRTEWENIVMSCYPCNTKKRNRTPTEAGMPLLGVPLKPAQLPMNEPVLMTRDAIPVEWEPFIGTQASWLKAANE